jgi:hypothetical protein
LDSLFQEQYQRCVDGGGTGLSYYFNDNNDVFQGFDVGLGIASEEALQSRFDLSVKSAFNDYYMKGIDGKGKDGVGTAGKMPDPHACDEALKSIRLLVSGAALINGSWMPQALEFLNY